MNGNYYASLHLDREKDRSVDIIGNIKRAIKEKMNKNKTG